MKTISVLIKINPAISKYLSVKFGIVSPYKLNEKHLIGQLICAVIGNRLNHKRVSGRVLFRLTDTLEIQVPEVRSWKVIRSVSDAKLVKLNTLLKTLLYEDFNLHMKYMIADGAQIDEAIMAWREKFGIREDELSMDGLKKHYQRHIR